VSTQKIYKAVVRVAKRRILTVDNKVCYLDIGAGRGELINLIGSILPIHAQACDYHTERFENQQVPIDKIDLNQQPLPYHDEYFDLVTCSEVVEHLENFRATIKEIYRVLKPGGIAILTTPNVLNVKSRIRYFTSGFYNLFGPLPVKNDKLYSTDGHITPIPYFYLAHALVNANFQNIELDIDKRQWSSTCGTIVFSPFLALGRLFFSRSENLKFKTITDLNREHVEKHFTWNILTARTVIVSAIKA
jgi:ubiquinone/menaquinone biosynthesis C-methylase UbiE